MSKPEPFDLQADFKARLGRTVENFDYEDHSIEVDRLSDPWMHGLATGRRFGLAILETLQESLTLGLDKCGSLSPEVPLSAVQAALGHSIFMVRDACAEMTDVATTTQASGLPARPQRC
jgi:hypothetical protein